MSKENPGNRAPRPLRIRRQDRHLHITWSDQTESDLPLEKLRAECPCAHCKGETILGKHYAPVSLPTFVEGMNEIESIEPVGSYAIQIAWKDGHSTGIYSWEYLRHLSGM